VVGASRASIYNWENGKSRNFIFHFPERSYSAGGLLTSATDLAKLAVALDAGRLLSSKSLEQMWRQEKLANGTSNSYGIGWVIKYYNGRKTVGHSGGPALADLVRFPEEKLTIAVLTNGQKLSPYLAQGVADFFLPPPAVKRMKGIDDNDPRTTRMLKQLLADAAQDKVNESLFSAEAQNLLFPLSRASVYRFSNLSMRSNPSRFLSIRKTQTASHAATRQFTGRRLLSGAFA
jgi:hypothetical protein